MQYLGKQKEYNVPRSSLTIPANLAIPALALKKKVKKHRLVITVKVFLVWSTLTDKLIDKISAQANNKQK